MGYFQRNYSNFSSEETENRTNQTKIGLEDRDLPRFYGARNVARPGHTGRTFAKSEFQIAKNLKRYQAVRVQANMGFEAFRNCREFEFSTNWMGPNFEERKTAADEVSRLLLYVEFFHEAQMKSWLVALGTFVAEKNVPVDLATGLKALFYRTHRSYNKNDEYRKEVAADRTRYPLHFHLAYD